MVKHELSAYMQVSAKVGQIKQFRIRSLFRSVWTFALKGFSSHLEVAKTGVPIINSQIRSF